MFLLGTPTVAFVGKYSNSELTQRSTCVKTSYSHCIGEHDYTSGLRMMWYAEVESAITYAALPLFSV